MGFLDFLSTTVGVDPGSQNLRIGHNGKLVFDELTAISVNSKNKVTGIGNDALLHKSDSIIKPVNGAIEDFHAFEMLLRGAIKKSLKESWFPKSYYILCCSYFHFPDSEKSL